MNLEQNWFPRANRSVSVVASDNYSVTPLSLIAAPAPIAGVPRRIRVQRIQVNILDQDASTVSVQSITTDVLVAAWTNPVVGSLPFDMGEEGFALPAGEGLELINSAAGMAFTLTITAYIEPVQ